MKIFSPKEVQAIIRHTIDHDGVSMTEVVNRMGAAVAKEVADRWDPGVDLVVFAGWDTNGAYALAASRLLIEQGYRPVIFLFNIGGSRISADCANQKKFLNKQFPQADFHEITSGFDIPELNSDCVVIDGLFGADIDRPISKSFGMLIRAINESCATVISIEIPSGLFSVWNTNNSVRDIIRATVTLCIEGPCLSFFMDEYMDLIGEWKVVDLDLSREAARNSTYAYYLIGYNDIHRILRPRKAATSKADYGSALLCAGSYGMMGAAVLSARACLRAGVGKLTCYAPKCGYEILQTAVPCAMYRADPAETAISRLVPDRDYSAIGIGPGMGIADSTIDAFEGLLKLCSAKSKPLVIDADALNCIAERPIMMNYLPMYSVLTPHAGEFDRIFGAQPSAEARLRKAVEIAAYHNIIMVLKGHYTAVVRPDGRVHINSSGTPALATPGSGDVLTGIITALMAQPKMSSETAAITGVYIHGVAGEIAERDHGAYGVTAADVADNVGRAIRTIMA